MSLSIAWHDDVCVVPAPGRPGAYCPATFRATWIDGAHIDITIGEDCIITEHWYLPDGLQGQTTRVAWRERIAEAIDGACWCVEQLTPAQLSARSSQSMLVAGRAGRIRVTDRLLEQVAAIAQDADKPYVEVAEKLGYSQPSASQRILEARRRGFLEPSSR